MNRRAFFARVAGGVLAAVGIKAAPTPAPTTFHTLDPILSALVRRTMHSGYVAQEVFPLCVARNTTTTFAWRKHA